MFGEYARIYDLVYSGKDYKKESEEITKIIKKYKKSQGNELLEFAVGTGNYLQYLKKYFHVAGVDISGEMLKIAKKKLHGIKLIKGDMAKINLGKQFDVVLCLFSSIGYAKNYKNLERTIKNFSRHLKKGGILIISPWFGEKNFKPGRNVGTYGDDNIKIARIYVAEKDKGVSILNLYFLISEKGKDVKYVKDRHELGLFERGKFLKIMKKNCLKSKIIKINQNKNAKKQFLSDDIKNSFFVGVKK